MLAVCVAVGAAVRTAGFVASLLQLRQPSAVSAGQRWQRAKGVVLSVLNSVDIVCMGVALVFLLHYSYDVMPSLRLYGDPQVRHFSSQWALLAMRAGSNE